MDAALKQRLIGAAVLVALAVIFLPMLVDGPEPTDGTAAVSLDLPEAPERRLETRELAVELPRPLAPASAPGASTLPPDPDAVATVEIESAPRVDAAPEADVAPPAASAPSTPSAAAPAAAASPPPPAPAVGAGTRFAVNLGTYANATNATALVAALKQAGLPAYVESASADGKPAQRVRLGPYAQRGEAEAGRLAATRVRSDLPASVVMLDADAGSAPAAVRAPVAAGFAVQIGALAAESDAIALRDRARAAGFSAYVERAATDAGTLWRVRVGPELQRARAEQLKTALAGKLRVDGVIVAHP